MTIIKIYWIQPLEGPWNFWLLNTSEDIFYPDPPKIKTVQWTSFAFYPALLATLSLSLGATLRQRQEEISISDP